MLRLQASAAAVATALSCKVMSASTQPVATPMRTAVAHSVVNNPIVHARRSVHTGDTGNSAAGSSKPTFAASRSSLPKGANTTAPSLRGVTQITSTNITEEMETRVPLFLYFTVTSHPEVAEYTKMVCHQVDQANRRLEHDNFGEVYQEFGKDAGLAIKIGIVDCLAEPALAKKFSVHPHMFPIIYFARNKAFVDKLVGIVTESQVKEAIEAFIDYGKKESASEKEGNTIFHKIKREDNDDENAMTLLKAAQDKLTQKQIMKAKELFQKALDYSLKEKEVVDSRLGVGKKKMDAEMWGRLKREGCYNTAPEALCGLAMCHLASREQDTALEYVTRVRREYPFSVSDLRSVAEALNRIEILVLCKMDVEKDNYLSLMKFDELTSDPIDFYYSRLKLAASHFIEGQRRASINECIRLIRAEPKLLPVLKEAGIVPKDLVMGPTAVTPARKLIQHIFEAYGRTDEAVIEGRKVLQRYL